MRILSYQRMSTEDGPGLRTTLFVKGCPLRCAWCHNPESISRELSAEWIGVRCMGCHTCVDTCANGGIVAEQESVRIDNDKCIRCFSCVSACPTGALERKGEDASISEIFAELIKDHAYFGADGGVTLSGGEILLQSEEAAELLRLLKESGVSTAVDTSGYCNRADIDRVLPYTDIFLFDLKLADSARHEEWTGVKNGRILENFEYLTELRREASSKFGLWVRTPIIPGATDDEENIRSIADIIGDKADRWELCAFNNLCRDKYERIYKDWNFKSSELMTRERMEALVAAASAAGAKNVRYTGRTRMEEERA
ncbi:MAG: glycyl-radical enzyme activating protein [Firmicutes bacterium HGW-Firmicutes-16]|nr:MAG: glycyl-radical enzyme activating protein [Firmicutes bacterium HGW-Firmicutes-16]